MSSQRDTAVRAARAEQAERALAEAQAALVGLREAAVSTHEALTRELLTHDGDPADFINGEGVRHLNAAHHALDDALATPADLAAQVRARHRAEALREAADRMQREYAETADDVSPEDFLRVLADEAETP